MRSLFLLALFAAVAAGAPSRPGRAQETGAGARGRRAGGAVRRVGLLGRWHPVLRSAPEEDPLRARRPGHSALRRTDAAVRFCIRPSWSYCSCLAETLLSAWKERVDGAETA